MKGIMKVAVAAVAVALCSAAKADTTGTTYYETGNTFWTFYIPSSESTGTLDLTVGAYLAYVFDWSKRDDVLSALSDKSVTTGTLKGLSFQSSVNTSAKDTTGPGWSVTTKNVSNIPDSLFAVIFNANESTFSSDSKYMIAQKNGEEKLAATDFSAGGSNYHMWSWGSQAANTWHDIGAVPEPTSGLLLLVGLSALALTRKRAA